MCEHRPSARPCGIAVVAVLLAGLAVPSPALRAGATEPFPEARPATRAQAVELLRGVATYPDGCLTPRIDALRGDPMSDTVAVRRALGLLQRRIPFARERAIGGPDGTLLRFTTEPDAFDRVETSGASGSAGVLDATLAGLIDARALLVEQLALPAPENLELLLVELGDDVDGYLVTQWDRLRRNRIVLDASPLRGEAGARAAAIHQYAHAVAHSAGPAFPAAWAEAFATWAVLALERELDPRIAARLAERIDTLGSGLLHEDPARAQGNALWFAFLQEAYGPAAVRFTAEELARGIAPVSALDRGVRRASTDDLAAAFREFHLWTILVGERADGRHFPFAAGIDAASFAAVADGLPALAVQTAPAVAPLGATQILLQPDASDGGLNLYFEGDFSARWEADLLLVSKRGDLRRLPLPLTTEGRGDTTIPLDGLLEVILLVRNLGNDVDGTEHRYTYAAHHEKGFPFELSALEAVILDDPARGIAVAWETESERRLIGFDLLRYREDGGSPTVVNPVWVPALGERGRATSYRYLDSTAEPGRAYVYRVRGVTAEGLTSLSDPVAAMPRSEPR